MLERGHVLVLGFDSRVPLIARELAQCNGALLLYEPRAGGGSIFRVVFADPQRWEGRTDA